ncbi:MAG: D-alanine--D-alanine ligase family protein, partial [Syntrophales bacterium]
GKYGEDGCVQGLLELLGLPYTGPGVLGSALGMDKHIQQAILRAAGIGVPASVLVREEQWREDREATLKALADRFGFPLFTKPPREGSSIGVTLVRDADALIRGVEEALRWDRAVLVEEYLRGKEFSSIILEEEGEPRALELTEITPQSDYFTYDDKYMPGRCRKFTPPRSIPADAVEAIKREAVRAFTALGFRSYGRIDGFYLPDGRILITDPNSASGMAPSSFFFEQAACAGMLPAMIVARLIENALVIHRQKNGPL